MGYLYAKYNDASLDWGDRYSDWRKRIQSPRDPADDDRHKKFKSWTKEWVLMPFYQARCSLDYPGMKLYEWTKARRIKTGNWNPERIVSNDELDAELGRHVWRWVPSSGAKDAPEGIEMVAIDPVPRREGDDDFWPCPKNGFWVQDDQIRDPILAQKPLPDLPRLRGLEEQLQPGAIRMARMALNDQAMRSSTAFVETLGEADGRSHTPWPRALSDFSKDVQSPYRRDSFGGSSHAGPSTSKPKPQMRAAKQSKARDLTPPPAMPQSTEGFRTFFPNASSVYSQPVDGLRPQYGKGLPLSRSQPSSRARGASLGSESMETRSSVGQWLSGLPEDMERIHLDDEWPSCI